MLNLNEITAVCESHDPNECWIEREEFYARAIAWLPALVAELTQAREELAAVDESLGDFYAPVLDPETEEPCGSFWKDHGVNVMRQELEQARAEIERLHILIESAAMTIGMVTTGQARALARRIEEAQE